MITLFDIQVRTRLAISAMNDLILALCGDYGHSPESDVRRRELQKMGIGIGVIDFIIGADYRLNSAADCILPERQEGNDD